MDAAYLRTLRTAARALVAALFCFAVFVSVCYFFSGGADPASGGLIIGTPDDWYKGVRVSITALLASAIGTLVYRRPYSRPMVAALAVGLVFLNLDPASVWTQVNAVLNADKWYKPSLVDVARRTRLYWVYYLAYMLWSVIVLYSGYIGQYLAGLAAFRRESRRESAAYVAENAGVGLLTSILAGIVAMFLAGALSYMAIQVFQTAANAPPNRTRVAIEAITHPPGKQPPVAHGPSGPPQAPPKPEPPQKTGLGPASFERLKVHLLLLALAFFVTAYVAALLFRPRTSTWVACGAIVGVMAFPAAAVRFVADPQAPTAFFRLLEISPFALAGTAVAAALSGDWLAKSIIARGFSPSRQQARSL